MSRDVLSTQQQKQCDRKNSTAPFWTGIDFCWFNSSVLGGCNGFHQNVVWESERFQIGVLRGQSIDWPDRNLSLHLHKLLKTDLLCLCCSLISWIERGGGGAQQIRSVKYYDCHIVRLLVMHVKHHSSYWRCCVTLHASFVEPQLVIQNYNQTPFLFVDKNKGIEKGLCCGSIGQSVSKTTGRRQ